MPEVSLVAESLDAAKTLAERTVGRFGGPFRGVREVILSDLSDPSVECSRWMRGRGWTDSQRQGS
ncbi:hypothetical protein [Sinomonas sp.]|uniref:hypothetical protein n=1 Tax=Sinomonas sp. TaxID=1914986 RepID=UPI002FE19E09